jgi:hypothetical protein
MTFADDRRRLSISPGPAPAAARVEMVEWHAPIRDAVVLRYRGLGPYTNRSRLTGRLYACGGAGASLRVDAADARGMLRTRLFKRA